MDSDYKEEKNTTEIANNANSTTPDYPFPSLPPTASTVGEAQSTLVPNPNHANPLPPHIAIDLPPARYQRQKAPSRGEKRSRLINRSQAVARDKYSITDVRHPDYVAAVPSARAMPVAADGPTATFVVTVKPPEKLNDGVDMEYRNVFPTNIPISKKAGSGASVICPLVVGFLVALLLYVFPWYLRVIAGFSTFYSLKSLSLVLSNFWTHSPEWQAELYRVFTKESKRDSDPNHIKRILSRPLAFYPQYVTTQVFSQFDRFVQWFSVIVGNSEFIHVGRISTTRFSTSAETLLDYRNAAVRANKNVTDRVELAVAFLQFPQSSTSAPIMYAPEIVNTVLPKITMMSEDDSFTQSQALSQRQTNLMIQSTFQAEVSSGSAQVAHILAAGRRVALGHVKGQMSLNSSGARSSHSLASVTGLLTASPFLLSVGMVLASPSFLPTMLMGIAYPLNVVWGLF